jgi:hypothetical protein
MEVMSIDSLIKQVESSLAEKKVKACDIYYAEDSSWAVVITTSPPDFLYGVSKSLLVVFINGHPEDTGSLYSNAFLGEDFYYPENELVKILSAEQEDKKVTLKVQKANGDTRDFHFGI